MKLREFIRETLVEIAHGVQEAKFATKNLIAISPGAMHGERLSEKSYVDFDVAVTVDERMESGKDGKGVVKAEINVFGSKVGGELGGGIGAKKESGTQTVTRVAFKVPLYMNAHFRGDKAIMEEEEFYNTLKNERD